MSDGDSPRLDGRAEGTRPGIPGGAPSDVDVNLSAHLAAIVESSIDAIYTYDFAGELLSWNHAAEVLYGYTAAEVLGQSVDVLIPEDRQHEAVSYIVAAVRRGERVRQFETVRRRKSGELFAAQITASPLCNTHGVPVAISAIVRDITEQRRQEQRLRLHAQITHQISDAIVATDTDLRVTFWNGAAEQMYGVPSAEAIGRPLTDLYTYVWGSPEEEAAAWRALDTTGAWRGENVHVTRDGRQIAVESVVTRLAPLDGRPAGLVASIRDITARKAAEHALRASERALRHSEEQLSLAKDAAELGIHDYDIPRNRIDWDARARALWGVEPDEPVTYETFAAGLHPDDAPATHAAVQRALDPAGDGQFSMEYRVVNRRDRQVHWVAATGRVIFSDGQPQRLVGTVQDITARKEAALQHQHTARRFRAVFDQQFQFMALVARDGTLLEMNELPIRLTGVERGTVIGRKFWDTPWWEPLPHMRRAWPDRLEAAAVATGPVFSEDEYALADGTVRLADCAITAIRNEGGQVECFVIQANDVTDRKRAEAEITRAAERAEVAQRAAGATLYEFRPATGEVIRNPSLEWVLGYVPEELDASKGGWRALVHPDDVAAFDAAATDAVRRGTPIALEYRVRHKAGHWVWMSDQAIVTCSATGEVERIVGLVMDVTARKQTEQSFQQSEERFRHAVNLAGLSPYTWDPATGALAWDARLKAMWGLPPEAQVDYDVFITGVHPADRAMVEARVAQALDPAGDGIYEAEFRVCAADGVERWVSARGRTTFADGQPAAYVGVAIDVTARKRAEMALRESEERLRLAQQAAQIGTFDWNIATGVNTWTPELEGMYGLAPGEFARTQPAWKQLVHPGDRASVSQLVQHAFETGLPTKGEWRIVWPDGSVHWIAGHWQVLKDDAGRPLRMTGINLDITERKRTEAALREADRQKDEFIAVLAHELRNPLAPIRTSMAVLRARASADPALMKCRDIIDRQVRHMARLLDDLLDVSRLSRGRLTLQRAPVRLRDIVADAVETVQGLVDDRGHTLTVKAVDPAIVLDADGARLTQTLTNLLANAAKYTDPGGAITVRTTHTDAEVTIEVRDTGIGLAPAVLDRIFDLFIQIEDARTRSEGGLGIGLALTKRLVELHGGRIVAASPGLGQGATFTMTLPLQTGAMTDVQTRSDVEGQPAPLPLRRRVLIVDDNADAADTLALLLDNLGCETRVAYDGHTALEEAERFQPDVVLLDLGLPGLDGQAVCRRVRAEAWGVNTVIAAITGWGQDEDRRRTKISGFDHHLVKPVDPGVLVKLIRDLPERHVM